MLDVEQTIKNYLPDIVHMSLATSRDNQPWVCEVHYAYDDELNLYFHSLTSRRHSLEIADNPKVAGNIVVQHALGEKPRGVYFEGTAEALDDVDENHVAYKAYTGRFGTAKVQTNQAAGASPAKFYKITVKKYYLFDARESSPAQKYELDWKS